MTLFPKKKPVGYLILGNLRAFGISAFKAILKFKRRLNHVKLGFLMMSDRRADWHGSAKGKAERRKFQKLRRNYFRLSFLRCNNLITDNSKYTNCKFYSFPITSPKQRTESSGLIGISSYLSFAEIRHRRPAFFMYPMPLTAKMPTWPSGTS